MNFLMEGMKNFQQNESSKEIKMVQTRQFFTIYGYSLGLGPGNSDHSLLFRDILETFLLT